MASRVTPVICNLSGSTPVPVKIRARVTAEINSQGPGSDQPHSLVLTNMQKLMVTTAGRPSTRPAANARPVEGAQGDVFRSVA